MEYSNKFKELRDGIIHEIIAEMARHIIAEYYFEDRPCLLAMPYNNDDVSKVFVKGIFIDEEEDLMIRASFSAGDDGIDDEEDVMSAQSNYFIISPDFEGILTSLRFELSSK
ncbi:MAG: hypothetical protein J6Y37_05885 [Paludibacteraceae bacterium]|nr:hypothetical protein [Paludibacteraceae bacterium]